MINIEDFKKLELKVAKVIEAEPVVGSDKLIRLQIDLGEEKRQVVAGIGKGYTPEELIGKKIVVLTNLEPRMLMGFESNGMLLAAHGDGPVLLIPDKDVLPGSSIG